MITQEPYENSIWRFGGNGPCNRLIFRIIQQSSTEIIAVTESSFMGMNAAATTLYSWLGGRFEFYRDFEFLGSPGLTSHR